MLTDPDRVNMQRMIHAGELATWPTVSLYTVWPGSVLHMNICASQLHMIENRFRLEREIFRGRLSVRQQSMYSAPSQDLPAPDTDPIPSRLEGGLGAPQSPATSRVILPSPNNELDADERPGTRSTKSSQLAIESEAEEDFESQSLKRPKSLHGGGSSRHSRASVSPTLRRSSMIGSTSPQQDDEGEYPFNGTIRARHPSLGMTTSTPGGDSRQSEPSTTSKLISRLRRRPFLARFPKRGQRQDDDEGHEWDDGALRGDSNLAVADAWSSDSSLAFEIDNSLENMSDSQEEEDSPGSQKAPDDNTRNHAPQQDL